MQGARSQIPNPLKVQQMYARQKASMEKVEERYNSGKEVMKLDKCKLPSWTMTL